MVIFGKSSALLPGSWRPFYVARAASLHAFQEEETVLRRDGCEFGIRTSPLQCQTQTVPEKD